MGITELWDKMVEYGIATEAELDLACDLLGASEATMRKVLYARTGFTTWETFVEDELLEGNWEYADK